MKKKKDLTAYFSMEFAFDSQIPNYAGGLGVLAADTMYACADLGLNVAGVTLLYHVDDNPRFAFDPSKWMKKLPETVMVEIEDRLVKVAIWEMTIKGKTGHSVPIYFLSSFLPENPKWDRDLTKNLYASDRYTRLGQEAILGIGGVRALKILGNEVKCFHMNEGHSACLTLELLRDYGYDEQKVRSQCTFTTHTPIAAGHDYFDYQIANKALGKILPPNIQELASKESLGMTQLALSLSKKVNAVSQKHREVCRAMFPNRTIESITNGIYHVRWTGTHMEKLFDTYLEKWQADPKIFQKHITDIPDKELSKTRAKEKTDLIRWINKNKQYFPVTDILPDDKFDEKTLTIGFARRFVPYKRPTLIFQNLDKLREIGYRRLQIIYAGRCHPDDQFCNNMRASIAHFATELRGQVKIALIPEYNLDIAKHLVSGCDIWLNNPLPPREASGTSGMKAALNGVLNLSILDGWWVEAFKTDPKSGWAFGEKEDIGSDNRDDSDCAQLMEQLEDAIDCYYHRKEEWVDRMKHAMALTAYFNTHRLAKEYFSKMWE